MAASNHRILIGLILLAGAVFFTPLIPDSLFLRFGPAKYDSDYVETFLTDEELAAVLTLVRAEGHYGVWKGEARQAAYISLFDYFFRYPEVGVLSVAEYDVRFGHGCPECTVQVTVGVVCGGLCSYGAVFLLAPWEESWRIDSHYVWIS